MSVESFVTAISDANGIGSATGTKGRFKVVHIDETDEGNRSAAWVLAASCEILVPSISDTQVTAGRGNSPDHVHPQATSRSDSAVGLEEATEADIALEKGGGFLKNLYDYQGGTFMPSMDDQSSSLPNAQLNTLFGVYLPCVQNIIGIIVFIRLYWVVGVSGVIEGMIIIGLCCLCTFLTAISLAASERSSSLAHSFTWH
jgi:hypothetical protein